MVNQINVVKEGINDKLLSIIHRIDNCEDILFYLIINKKIEISSKHLQGIILKNYNSLFKYWYKNEYKDGIHNYTFSLTLLSNCIVYNNSEIFNILFEDNKKNISKEEFTKLLFDNRDEDLYINRNEFIHNLLNNYLNYIKKDSNLIHICILSNMEDEIIIHLVNDGYLFTYEDMEIILKNRKVKVLEEMCQVYNKRVLDIQELD